MLTNRLPLNCSHTSSVIINQSYYSSLVRLKRASESFSTQCFRQLYTRNQLELAHRVTPICASLSKYVAGYFPIAVKLPKFQMWGCAEKAKVITTQKYSRKELTTLLCQTSSAICPIFTQASSPEVRMLCSLLTVLQVYIQTCKEMANVGRYKLLWSG